MMSIANDNRTFLSSLDSAQSTISMKQLVAWLFSRYEISRQRYQLSQLPKHRLSDMGIEEAQLKQELNKAWWED